MQLAHAVAPQVVRFVAAAALALLVANLYTRLEGVKIAGASIALSNAFAEARTRCPVCAARYPAGQPADMDAVPPHRRAVQPASTRSSYSGLASSGA